jgi:hypothetical protein
MAANPCFSVWPRIVSATFDRGDRMIVDSGKLGPGKRKNPLDIRGFLVFNYLSEKWLRLIGRFRIRDAASPKWMAF